MKCLWKDSYDRNKRGEKDASTFDDSDKWDSSHPLYRCLECDGDNTRCNGYVPADVEERRRKRNTKLKKATSSVVGLYMLLPQMGHSASREELKIPDGKCIEAGIDAEHGVYVEHLDVDNDGKWDIEQVYEIVGVLMEGVAIRKGNPNMLWFDRNKNREVDNNELYLSPNSDEDWKPVYKRLEI